jgi:hypothetical protein
MTPDRDQAIVAALSEIATSIVLIAWQIERMSVDQDARNEITQQIHAMRDAMARLEDSR